MQLEEKVEQKKLEYIYDNKNIHYEFIGLIAIIVLISKTEEGRKINFQFYLLFTLLALIIMIGLYFKNKRKLKVNENKKYNGMKITGIIENVSQPAGFLTPNRRPGPNKGRLYIKTKNKEFSVGMIRENDAYRLVYYYLAEKIRRQKEIKCEGEIDQDMLFYLDITVDIYIDGSTIYADLDSIDIEAIEKRYNYFIKSKNKK